MGALFTSVLSCVLLRLVGTALPVTITIRVSKVSVVVVVGLVLHSTCKVIGTGSGGDSRGKCPSNVARGGQCPPFFCDVLRVKVLSLA